MGKVNILFQKWRGSYSRELGINLEKRDSKEVGKWFIASLLFGARISEAIAMRTYREFERNNLIVPDRILESGWDRFVEVLDSGGYSRYDFKTATKFLEVMRNLKERYGGNLNILHDAAANPRDLEQLIKSLGKGVGDVTVNIFLRELRGIWVKAQPLPQRLVITAARELSFTEIEEDSEVEREEMLKDLLRIWEENRVEGKDFVDFEATLLRAGKNHRRNRILDD